MDNKQIEDVKEMLEDVIESVKSVHGDGFTQFVMMMTNISQVYNRVAAISNAALDPDYNAQKEYFVRKQTEIVETLLASLCVNIGNVCNLSEQQLEEGLEWSSRIVDMAYSKREQSK